MYDNSAYWENIHKQYTAQLKAVGHPWLSEQLNVLKYKSEADTVLNVLADVRQKWGGKKELSLLDVGAGTGYWTHLVYKWLIQEGFTVQASVLDISLEALEIIQVNNPGVQVIHEDLKTIDLDLYSNTFDLVFSGYCLHHLINIDEFLNGLRFAGRSVGEGGFLIIMDPILTKSFSNYDTFDFVSYKGNGVPRHLYLLDDVLLKEGMKRQDIKPAISFLLNGSLEANSPLGFNIRRVIWQMLQIIIYRSEGRTRRASKILTSLDRFFKNKDLAFSASVCVYQKT